MFCRLILTTLLIPSIIVLLPSPSSSEPLTFLNQINGKTAAVIKDEAGKLSGKNSDILLTPASVQKILTTYAAIKLLGKSRTFKTYFYLSSDGKFLRVQGEGDPSLTDEIIRAALKRIPKNELSKIKRVEVKDTFTSTLPSRGIRAYEAGTSSIPFNFNSVETSVCGSKRGQSAYIRKTLPSEKLKIENKVVTSNVNAFNVAAIPGGVRFTGKIHGGCIKFYVSSPNPMEGLKEFLQNELKIAPLKNTDSISPGKDFNLLFEIISPPLSELVTHTNHSSSNLFAEQLLSLLPLAEGKSGGYSQGLQILKNFWKPFLDYRTVIADGSGLSRENKITSKDLLQVLEVIKNDSNNWETMLESLPIYGVSGTLKNRKSPGCIVRAKSGTLNGVSTLAGYVNLKVPFVIMQNESIGLAKGRLLEEKIIKEFCSLHPVSGLKK